MRLIITFPCDYPNHYLSLLAIYRLNNYIRCVSSSGGGLL